MQARLLQYSSWDWMPVMLGLAHLAGVLAVFLAFPWLSWWSFIPLALIYSLSISWNINSVSHNFIHNPYFRNERLNAGFSLILSLTLGFSQAMYHFVHMRHHSGNMDRPDEKGRTLDYLSIYKHGHDGKPENVWRYTFLSYFRDDPAEILRAMAARRPGEARQAKMELAVMIGFYLALAVIDWRFVACMLPFNYLGQCLSSLNGYYEHFGGDPDKPLAWGVSTYDRLYNWTWMNNGYHAEHHYRPKVHWTKMPELHRTIADEQGRAGTRVIRPPHPLGFLDADIAEH
ncbi:fatty acid desaturase [Labrys miyagiensis]|uniref:Fatty acid desaturase n=1 Tax=Labrys miyagiensis TaxID=346912 RepID=A0ABQ6CAN5_9HYPH|nr:fatty acid desaturase [Labrys miyagiensis]GLS17448.1 fatty acid desaturase [Labrys miyagiensis]